MIFNKADLNDLEALVQLRINYLTEDYNGLSEEQISTLEKISPIILHVILEMIFLFILQGIWEKL